MNNNAKALKSGLWYTFSNFLIQGINLLTTPVFARLLSKSEFGLYNNYLSWLSVFTILTTLRLESTLISAKFDYEKSFDSYIYSTNLLGLIITLGWFAIINIFHQFFTELTEVDWVYLNVMMVYLLFFPSINLFQARERYRYEYKRNILVAVILATLTAGISVSFVLGFKDKLSGRIYGGAIPTVVIGMILFVILFRRGGEYKVEHWKYALPVCLPYVPHLLSLTVLNATDRIMITRFCGSEYTAIYSLAYTCGLIVTLLSTSYNSAYAPWLGEKLHEQKHEEIREFAPKYILSFLFFSAGIMLIGPDVLRFMGGKSYGDAIFVLPPVATGCFFQFVYSMFVNVEQFKKKTVWMAMASVAAAGINFVLNLIFIPRYGYYAAAYTTLVGYIVLLVLHMIIVYKMGYGRVYNYKFVGFIGVIATVVMIGVTFIYQNNIIRIVFVVTYISVLAVFVYKNKARLLSLLRLRGKKITPAKDRESASE